MNRYAPTHAQLSDVISLEVPGRVGFADAIEALNELIDGIIAEADGHPNAADCAAIELIDADVRRTYEQAEREWTAYCRMMSKGG